MTDSESDSYPWINEPIEVPIISLPYASLGLDKVPEPGTVPINYDEGLSLTC
jgi:hypothetical protein